MIFALRYVLVFLRRKMALFRGAKNGEKLCFSRCEMRRKMVQVWAVSWVEPVFRDFFREKWHFFSRSEMRRKMALISRSEKWRKNILFAVRNAAKNGPVLGCELGRACFSRNFSRKMALFFAERNAAKNGALFLAKNGEKRRFPKEI
jgi:hypothetical protein